MTALPKKVPGTKRSAAEADGSWDGVIRPEKKPAVSQGPDEGEGSGKLKDTGNVQISVDGYGKDKCKGQGSGKSSGDGYGNDKGEGQGSGKHNCLSQHPPEHPSSPIQLIPNATPTHPHPSPSVSTHPNPSQSHPVFVYSWSVLEFVITYPGKTSQLWYLQPI